MEESFDYKNREREIYFFYKQFLFKHTKEEMLNDLHQSFNEYQFPKEKEEQISLIINNFEIIEEKVKAALPFNWKWMRINNLEKGILLYSASEIILLKKKKAIVINNAIIYAKKYCDIKTYRLINLILDNIKLDENTYK